MKRVGYCVFDELMEAVPKKYNCYVEFFQSTEEGDPSSLCPPLDVPQFHHSYQVDGLEYDLGVPRCIRKSDGYNFAPTRKYQLADCKEQVEIFTGEKSFGYSMNAESAQKQYDTYMQNLRRELDQRIDEAVRKFNCYADGNEFCI